VAERKVERGLYATGAGMMAGGGIMAQQQYARARAQRLIATQNRGGKATRLSGVARSKQSQADFKRHESWKKGLAPRTVRIQPAPGTDPKARWKTKTGFMDTRGGFHTQEDIKRRAKTLAGNAESAVAMERKGTNMSRASRVAVTSMRRGKAFGRIGMATAGVGALTTLAGLERRQSTNSRSKDRAAAGTYKDLSARKAQLDGHSPAQYRGMSSKGGLQRDAAGNVKRADRMANPKQLRRLERNGFTRNDGESTADYHNRARNELSQKGIRNSVNGDAANEWLRRNREEMDKPMPHAYADDKKYAQPALFRGYEDRDPRSQR
jgi:hypothetical protein